MFHNQGGVFTDITTKAGLERNSYVVRGLLCGDIDNDGDTDVVLCQSNRPAVILRNEIGHRRKWISVQLVGRDKNREAIGARVRLTANGMTQTREVICGASYLAGNDLRLLFGVGDTDQIEQLQVRWADGSTERLGVFASRKFIVLRQK